MAIPASFQRLKPNTGPNPVRRNSLAHSSISRADITRRSRWNALSLAELIRRLDWIHIGRSGETAMMRKQAVSAIALLITSSIAVAQQPNAVHGRGTIESKDHQTLDVRGRGGETLKVKLADNAPVRTVVKA
jgi:hypothetical protein